MALFNSVPFLPGGIAVRAGVMIGAYALLLMLIPIAMVGARRYRLSRISWRNIRFSFQGRARTFIPIFAGGLLLTGLTLGFYYPFWVTSRQAFMVSHSHFGNQAFGFDGRGRALFLPFLLAALDDSHPGPELGVVRGSQPTVLVGSHLLWRGAVPLYGDRLAAAPPGTAQPSGCSPTASTSRRNRA